MKTTTLLLLLTLSVSVQSRLISGTVNLTKDTTGINFVNDTIQLVTNDTCKYPDCKRVYYCGDTSAPDFFFIPVRLGETQQYESMGLEIGSTKPLYSHYAKSIEELLNAGLASGNIRFTLDTTYDSIGNCKLPYLFFDNCSIYPGYKLYLVGKTKTNLFFLLETHEYYTVTSFNPVNWETWYDFKGIHVKWWLQTNGKLDFDDLVKTDANIRGLGRKLIKNEKQTAQNCFYTIRGQKISPEKAGALSGKLLINGTGKFTIINNIKNNKK